MTNTEKRGVGRPKGKHVDYSRIGLLYKHHSNREIAEKLDCSIPNVCIRRNKLIAQARANNVEDKDNPYIFVGNKQTGTKPRNRKPQAEPVAVSVVEEKAE